MNDALVFEGVRKRYGRDAWALDGLSFRIPRGVMCGFIGPNGAGKTTSFSVVSGFLPPDDGRVDVLGLGPFDVGRMRGRLGVLPQDAELPGRHSPFELLEHLGRLQGLSAADARREANLQLRRVQLDGRRDGRIDSLSHGMRRRVAVASALIGRPELVLLDEPTAGLDPVQAIGLREVLGDLAGSSTVVVSSHNLLELERMCDWVVMIDRGRCLRQGSVSDVTGRRERLEWTLGPGAVELAALRAAAPGQRVELVGRELAVTLSTAAGAPDADTVALGIMRALVDAGVAAREMRRGMSLEQRFVDDARRSNPSAVGSGQSAAGGDTSPPAG